MFYKLKLKTMCHIGRHHCVTRRSNPVKSILRDGSSFLYTEALLHPPDFSKHTRRLGQDNVYNL